MKTSLLLTLLLGLLPAACYSENAPVDSVSVDKAKEYFARIRPGMTFGDVRKSVPHIREYALMLNYAGLDYCLELSDEYHVLVRVSHSGKHGPSEDERRLFLRGGQKLIDHYDKNLMFASPSLQDRKGHTISKGYQP